MNLWALERVQEHEGDDREGAILGDFPGLVEAHFAGCHANQIDPLGETLGPRLCAEGRQTVNALVAEAAVPVA